MSLYSYMPEICHPSTKIPIECPLVYLMFIYVGADPAIVSTFAVRHCIFTSEKNFDEYGSIMNSKENWKLEHYYTRKNHKYNQICMVNFLIVSTEYPKLIKPCIYCNLFETQQKMLETLETFQLLDWFPILSFLREIYLKV